MFCQEGLQCEKVTMKSAIRLGESNANDQTNIKPGHYSWPLKTKNKAKIFAALKNLITAEDCYKSISYSTET